MAEINGHESEELFDKLIRANLEILRAASKTKTKSIIQDGIDIWNWILDTDGLGGFDNYCTAAGYNSDIIRIKLLRLGEEKLLSRKELREKLRRLSRRKKRKPVKSKLYSAKRHKT